MRGREEGGRLWFSTVLESKNTNSEMFSRIFPFLFILGKSPEKKNPRKSPAKVRHG
jgi:hypothetical protein